MEKNNISSNVDLNPLYTLTNIISHGITINTGKDTISIPGLFNGVEHSKTDNKLLFVASIMIYLSNNITISIDSYGEKTIVCSDVDILNKTSVGGGDNDLGRFMNLQLSNKKTKVILNIEPSKSGSIVNNLIRIIISIITLFLTMKGLFYLYENQMKIAVEISKASIEDIEDKYRDLLPTSRVRTGKRLIQEYMVLGKDTTKDEDVYLQPYLEVLALSYKETDTQMQLQIYTVDDPLPSLEELDFNNLGTTASELIIGYQKLLSYFPFLKFYFIDTDDFIHNYAIYQKAQQKYTTITKEIEDLEQLFNKFKAKLAQDINTVDPRNKKMVEVATDALSNFVTGFWSGNKNSNFDIALAKKQLIPEIIDVWSEIFTTTATNSNKLFKSITKSFTQIIYIYSLLQWQIAIVGIIYSFANYIIYKYVLKNIKVKLNPKEFKTLTENINILIKTEMNTYYRTNDSRLNQQEKEELINTITHLLNTFMYKGNLSINEGNIELTISQKTSNVIDFRQNQSEILADVQKFVLDLNNTLEKVDNFSYNSIVNVLNTFFGNIDNLEENNIKKISDLLNQIYEFQGSDYSSETPIKNPRNILRLKNEEDYEIDRIERIDGGKKHNKKSRKTRTIKTRRHKRSKIYKRTRRNKITKRNKK